MKKKEIKIEKNIPVKLGRGSVISMEELPLDSMEIGDSFRYYRPRTLTLQSTQSTLYFFCKAFIKSKNPTAKFSTKQNPTAGYVRVWRVA